MNREAQAVAQREIEELEKKMMGDPAGTPDPGDQDTASADQVNEGEEQELEVQPATQEEAIVETDDPAEPEVTATPQSDQPDWKKRFINFKASADATIAGLRRENISLREEVQRQAKAQLELSKRVDDLSKGANDPYKELFTQEERDIIGDETLAALQKANDAALNSRLKPIQDQLEKERKLRQDQEAKALARDKENLSTTFLQRLGTLVPGYQKIDTNPQFHEWMKGVDTASGFPRVHIFKTAQANMDVGRVADFFLQFQAASKPKDKLGKKVTPMSGGNAGAPEGKPKAPVITQAFIDKFYEASIRGDYRGRQKEQQAIEKMIDDHLRSLARR
jgi:hypothetical protein